MKREDKFDNWPGWGLTFVWQIRSKVVRAGFLKAKSAIRLMKDFVNPVDIWHV